ncbi:MAG: TfoX/Sxy family protein [Candidatus Eisenbacteria bacterium]
MAYDEGLAERLAEILARRKGVTSKKMFGGLCYLLGGKMFVGIVKDTLMVRVGPAAYADALAQPHAREMDFTGKPMKGYVFVAPAGFDSDRDLRAWVDRALAFAATLQG